MGAKVKYQVVKIFGNILKLLLVFQNKSTTFTSDNSNDMTIEEQIQSEFDAILEAENIEVEKQASSNKIEGDFSGLIKFIDKGVQYKIEEIVVVGCNPYGI